MYHPTTDDVHIQALRPLISPALLLEDYTLQDKQAKNILAARETCTDIIQGKDDRLLVVVGPCSIHDPRAALDYAKLLKQAHEQFKQDLFLVMRIYFEKPRTTIGWKGLINDPFLNNSFEINQGLRAARKLLLDVAELELPSATEFLDTIVPQYISDLIAWGAIGARTTESQIHRELASGLSMPIGFKNGTRGNVQIAVDAAKAATHPHHFLSVTKQGVAAIVSTTGNKACHLILRGGEEPNYEATHVQAAIDLLNKAKLHPSVMIDCSHGNSKKDHNRQTIVVDDICAQMQQEQQTICGLMLESHLFAGRQDLVNKEDLAYGKSVTDACISWQDTVPLFEKLAKAVQQRREKIK